MLNAEQLAEITRHAARVRAMITDVVRDADQQIMRALAILDSAKGKRSQRVVLQHAVTQYLVGVRMIELSSVDIAAIISHMISEDEPTDPVLPVS